MPERVWCEMDYAELEGVLEVYAEMQGARQPVKRMDDLDRQLIAELKEKERAAA